MENSKVQRVHRPRVLKGATIIVSLKKSEIPCTVRNQHAHGAELRIPIDAAIPEEFTLYVPADGIGYQAVVQWRHNDRIGVKFVGIGPKPKFHYG